MTPSQIKQIADRLAASNCSRISCAEAAKEIAAAMTQCFRAGYAAGAAEGKVSDRELREA